MNTSDKKRVVITGLGVVSSIGVGSDSFLSALQNGVTGSSEVQSFNTDKFPSHIGCEVKNFDANDSIENIAIENLGRSSQMAIAATHQALIDSGLSKEKLLEERCDVVMGTTDGESAIFDEFVLEYMAQPTASFEQLPQLVTAEAISDSVQEAFSLTGDSVVLATACSAGNYSIGYAFDKISSGEVDVVVCGGSDSQCLKNFGGFYRIGALAPESCSPFDINRKGILPGEGSGVLILESLDSAQKRNAKIYAEILGYGASCDGHHVMQPNLDGIIQCNQDALKRCNVKAEDIDYICAHGTATTINDVVETAAMKSIYAENMPPMSSIKSMLGHTMGAASALSAIACALAIKYDFMPPTANFKTPDPECDIDCIPNKARNASLNLVQNNAFAFGGNNAIVLLKRFTNSVE